PQPVEILSPATTPVAKPAECRWALDEAFDGQQFRQRGRFEGLTIATLLFVTCFWNSIVCVFVLNSLSIGLDADMGLARIPLLIFMIAFAAIGLGMIIALLLHLCEAVRQTTWRFSPGTIRADLSWFGLGPSWNYSTAQLDRIELRFDENAEASRRSPNLRKS